jgi:hypothetical protein
MSPAAEIDPPALVGEGSHLRRVAGTERQRESSTATARLVPYLIEGVQRLQGELNRQPRGLDSQQSIGGTWTE